MLAPARMSRCVHPVPLTTLTTSHLLIPARTRAPRPAALFNHHVLAAGGAFFITKKALLLVEHSFAVTFYTAVHAHAEHRPERPAGALQLPLTLLTSPYAHSRQVGQDCDPPLL